MPAAVGDHGAGVFGREAVKIVDSVATAGNNRTHIAAFRFANSATDLGCRNGLPFPRGGGGNLERMHVESTCRTPGRLKRFASPDFQMFPASFPREANKPVFYYARHFRVKNERLAHIAEWEADTASSGERTVHFHQWYQRGQPASRGKIEDKKADGYKSYEALLPRHWCESSRRRDARQPQDPNLDFGGD